MSVDYRMITKIVRNMKLKRNSQGNELNDNEAETLRFITKHPNCIGNEIVDYLNVDKSLVARMIKKLEENAYITIEVGTDKRKRHLVATEKGLSDKYDEQKFEISYYEEVFSDFSDEEKQQLFSLLERAYLKSKRMRKGLK